MPINRTAEGERLLAQCDNIFYATFRAAAGTTYYMAQNRLNQPDLDPRERELLKLDFDAAKAKADTAYEQAFDLAAIVVDGIVRRWQAELDYESRFASFEPSEYLL